MGGRGKRKGNVMWKSLHIFFAEDLHKEKNEMDMYSYKEMYSYLQIMKKSQKNVSYTRIISPCRYSLFKITIKNRMKNIYRS